MIYSLPGAIVRSSNHCNLFYTAMTANAMLRAGQDLTGVTNDFIFAQVNSAEVTRSRMCYINVMMQRAPAL